MYYQLVLLIGISRNKKLKALESIFSYKTLKQILKECCGMLSVSLVAVSSICFINSKDFISHFKAFRSKYIDHFGKWI